MLKVVGASWLQTKISTSILVAMGILAIIALFLGEMERVQDDGTYSSTVYWTHKTGFKVESWGQGNDLLAIPKGAARAAYRADNSKTGWAILEIETNSFQPDWVQAYSAGLLEGTLSWQAIAFHWNNVVKSFCDLEENIEHCDKVRIMVKQNADAVRVVAKQRNSEAFWHQVSLFYDQLDGLEYGFRHGVTRSRQSYEIPTEDFLLMNNPRLLLSGDETSIGNRSLLFVKLLEHSNSENILVGHSTDGSYNSMLRMIKRYRFGYHTSDGSNQLIPTSTSVFSGYPGALSSHDDLYLISGDTTKMIVAGTVMKTSGKIHDKTLDYVPQAPRIMAANRLSHGGRSWSRHFIRSSEGSVPYNEGTQWILADLTRLRHNESDNDEILEKNHSKIVPEHNDVDEDVATNILPEKHEFDHIIFETGHLSKKLNGYLNDRPRIISPSIQNLDLNDDSEIVSIDNNNLESGTPLKDEDMNNYVELESISELNEKTFDKQLSYLRNMILEEQPWKIKGGSIKHGKLKGLVWLVETTSTISRASDISLGFRTLKYWTNGISYFEDLINSSTEPISNLNWIEYVLRHHKNITDLDRLNTLLHDKSVRDDLGSTSKNSGNIDIKLLSVGATDIDSQDGVINFQLAAGPAFTSQSNSKIETVTEAFVANSEDNNLEPISINKGNVALMAVKAYRNPNSKTKNNSKPFNWLESNIKDNNHNGQPDLWDFPLITPIWAWIN